VLKVNGVMMVIVLIVCKTVRFVLICIHVLLVIVILNGIHSITNVK